MPGKSPSVYVQFPSKMHQHGNTRTGLTGGTEKQSDPLPCYGIPLIPVFIHLHRTSAADAGKLEVKMLVSQSKTAVSEFYDPSEFDTDYVWNDFTVDATSTDFYFAMKFPAFGTHYCAFNIKTTSTDSFDVDIYLPGGGGDWREPPPVGDPDGWGFEETDDDP